MNPEHAPRSRRWQYAVIGAAIGALAAVAVVLAARGPAVIYLDGAGCCCCERAPCAKPRSDPAIRPGYRPQSRTTPPVGETPREHPGDHRRALPWYDRIAKREPAPVPVPGALALFPAGLVAWRLQSALS